jgi:hypothetical protein
MHLFYCISFSYENNSDTCQGKGLLRCGKLNCTTELVKFCLSFSWRFMHLGAFSAHGCCDLLVKCTTICGIQDVW